MPDENGTIDPEDDDYAPDAHKTSVTREESTTRYLHGNTPSTLQQQ